MNMWLVMLSTGRDQMYRETPLCCVRDEKFAEELVLRIEALLLPVHECWARNRGSAFFSWDEIWASESEAYDEFLRTFPPLDTLCRLSADARAWHQSVVLLASPEG